MKTSMALVLASVVSLSLSLSLSAHADEVISKMTQPVDLLDVTAVSLQSTRSSAVADKAVVAISAVVEGGDLCLLQSPVLSLGYVANAAQPKTLGVLATGDGLDIFMATEGCAGSSRPMPVQILAGLSMGKSTPSNDYFLPFMYGSKLAKIHLSHSAQGAITVSLEKSAVSFGGQ